MSGSGELQPQGRRHRPGRLEPACRLSISRCGSAVTIVLTCTDDYAAMKLYEDLIASAQTGELRMGLTSAASG